MADEAWTIQVWESAFDDRARAIAETRAAGRTLEETGAEFGVSGERVRQVITQCRRRMVAAADAARQGWRETLRSAGVSPAVRREVLADALGVRDHVVLESLLPEAGLSAPQTWTGALRGWWTAHPTALDSALRQLVAGVPLHSEALSEAARLAGLPNDIPLIRLLDDPRSKVARNTDGHWVRRNARGRDSAYLHLLEVGSPRTADELVRPMSVPTEKAARGALRRDDRFVQIRPEGTWALTEWAHLRLTPYSNAVEALVAVVTEQGPISRGTLFARITELYPVTPWRLTQCLLSDQIGETVDGLIDLVARGAEPLLEAEPAKPADMAMSGDVLGARILVDRDVLRGSGVRVRSWLTWRLGLRQAPMSRTFTTAGGHAPLTIRRGTSFAQVSTLRGHALELGVVGGCVLALLLNLKEESAQVRHGCQEGSCPARATDSA
ncbi:MULTISPECIES: sigma factor-like helix-turn-helix DNA-binding protein [unclassified Streptomyces]|uniref:sigma factor-like helix-turn-helix DNA-binding protein n=1 Tax=unclassified Streptomyces TaxID=2593676 RepID=UPI00365E60AA